MIMGQVPRVFMLEDRGDKAFVLDWGCVREGVQKVTDFIDMLCS